MRRVEGERRAPGEAAEWRGTAPECLRLHRGHRDLRQRPRSRVTHEPRHPHGLELRVEPVQALQLPPPRAGPQHARPQPGDGSGADPATASGIFLTTATDVVSMGLFLSLATLLVL